MATSRRPSRPRVTTPPRPTRPRPRHRAAPGARPHPAPQHPHLNRDMARRLRVPRHRATTAHLCSAYPFLAEAGLGHRGVYLGTNLLTGGGGFAYDPFEAYQAGLVTNPN